MFHRCSKGVENVIIQRDVMYRSKVWTDFPLNIYCRQPFTAKNNHAWICVDFLHDWSIHRMDILINLFISVDLLELWAPCPELFSAVCTKEALSWSPNEALLSEINTVYTVQQLSLYSYFIQYACTRFEYNLLAMVSIIEVNLLKPSLSD